MDQIASFEVDHTKLEIGMYTSRVDGDIVTYDVRMAKPNGKKYLSSASLHTIEHLFATYARNTKYRENIIYVGPMGCRTGFYFIVRDRISPEKAVGIVKAAMEFIRNYDGEIPGISAEECGNYLEHDLAAAKKDVVPIFEILQTYKTDKLDYNR